MLNNIYKRREHVKYNWVNSNGHDSHAGILCLGLWCFLWCEILNKFFLTEILRNFKIKSWNNFQLILFCKTFFALNLRNFRIKKEIMENLPRNFSLPFLMIDLLQYFSRKFFMTSIPISHMLNYNVYRLSNFPSLKTQRHTPDNFSLIFIICVFMKL